MEKWLIPGLAQEKYMTSLEHLSVLRRKNYSKKDGACQKDTGTSLKEFSLTKFGITRVSRDIKIVLDYNPLSKINIPVMILVINKQNELFLTTEVQPVNTEGIIRVKKSPFATII